MQFDRKELAEEILLREHIRKAIKIVKKRKFESNLKQLNEEKELRRIIRKLIIQEAKKVPKWDSYGKNNLDVMFMKTNFLDALETGYKSLTTTQQQRESFKIHIIVIRDTLLKFWGKMDLEEDKDIFYDNLVQQLGLYFDNWEGQLTPTPGEETLTPEEPAPEDLDLGIEGGEEELELEL